MKLKSTLLAATLVIFSAFNVTAFAVDVHDTNTGMKKAETVKAEKAEVKKPVKRHNHMEEKTGMPMAEPTQAAPKEVPKNRHDHMKEKQ